MLGAWLIGTGTSYAQTEPVKGLATDTRSIGSDAPGASGALAPDTRPDTRPDEEAPPATKATHKKASRVCVWGRPLSKCKSSPIVELGFGWAQSVDETMVINGDFGWLVSRPGNNGVGATLGVMCNPDCNFSVKGRYRHYLASWVSFDLSPGFYVGTTRGLQLEAAFQVSDFIALTGGFTTTSSNGNFETGRLGYVGIRMGLPFMILALAVAGGA